VAGTTATPSTRKHLRVRTYLTELLASGLAVGDAIPSERALTERFDVSRTTVRQAIDALVAEGLLERAQGRGTFVAPPRVDFEMRLTTFGEEVRRRGMTPGSQVLQAATVPCPPTVADTLALRVGASAHRVLRVRTADGEPWAVEDAWIPAVLAPDRSTTASRSPWTPSCAVGGTCRPAARRPSLPPTRPPKRRVSSPWRACTPSCGSTAAHMRRTSP
jgi:DNA-binding GntR family transcriptional regulator